jgi:hypothetical protein
MTMSEKDQAAALATVMESMYSLDVMLGKAPKGMPRSVHYDMAKRMVSGLGVLGFKVEEK